MVIRAGTIRFYDSGKTSRRVGFDFQFANFSMIPAFALGVGILLDDMVGVKIIHANLFTYPSGGVTEMWEYTNLFPFEESDGSKWRGDRKSVV